MKKAVCTALSAVCLLSVAQAGQRVKVFAHGWDTLAVTPAQVLENADQLDRLPIDGLFLNVSGKSKDGARFTSKRIAFDKKWDFEAFRYLLPTLRQMKNHRSLRHSFLGAWISNTWKTRDAASRKKWTDDEAWATFANNLGVLARIARESDIEGIQIDNEDYSGIKQFTWQESDGDYDEVRKLARKRGKEVFGAAFREKPDLKVLAFWFMSWPFGNYLASADPEASRRAIHDLWPDFVNGMIDSMPEEARFIDGDETTYYSKADRDDFFRKAVQLRKNVMPLVEPENRVAYRGKLMFAPATYLDAMMNGSTSSFYMPPVDGGTRVDRFFENFNEIAEAADGYTWLYGERNKFINWKGVKIKRCADKTWDEVLPGIYDAIGCVRDAAAHGKFRFTEWEKNGCVPPNLVESGSCALDKVPDGATFLTNRFAKGFSTWTLGKNPGVLGTDTACGHGDRFSMRVEKVRRGCLLFHLDGMKIGDHYVVRVFGKGKGVRGSVDFVNTVPSYPISFDEQPGPDGWRAGYSYIVVPKNVTKMRIMLGGSKDETLWYDDIGIYADPLK